MFSMLGEVVAFVVVFLASARSIEMRCNSTHATSASSVGKDSGDSLTISKLWDMKSLNGRIVDRFRTNESIAHAQKHPRRVRRPSMIVDSSPLG